MKIPDKVKIGGLVYDVKHIPNLTRDRCASGESCGNELTITIENSLPQQNKETTLLHEIIEQINYVYNLELEHHKICLLETALYQVIKDNPEIFAPEPIAGL